MVTPRKPGAVRGRPPKAATKRAVAAALASGDPTGEAREAGVHPTTVARALVRLQRQPAAAPVSPASQERADAVRRLIVAGEADAGLVGRLAVTFGASVGDVRALLVAAAAQVELDELPPELAREESVALARRVRRKAEESADWKTALSAQAHMDRLRGLGQPGRTAGGDYSRSEVVSMLRRVAAAVAPWPGAVAAAREALGAT